MYIYPYSHSPSVTHSGAEPTPYKPTPLSYKGPAPSHVDQVLITSNEGGDLLVKVRTTATICPLVDQLPSFHHRKSKPLFIYFSLSVL